MVLVVFYWGWVGLDAWLPHDNAIYLYSGMQLLEGIPPYQSIFDIKTPFGSFVAALGIGVGSLLDVSPLRSVRAIYAVIAASAGSGLYLILRNVAASKAAALVGAFLVITIEPWLLYIGSGPRPKVLATALLIWVFYGVLRERWIFTGILSGLAVLTWQPCILVFIAIIGALLRCRRRETVRVLASFLSGAAIPVALTAAYFGLTNAWEPFVDGSLRIHLGYVRGRAQINPLVGLMTMFKLAHPLWTFLWLGGAVAVVTGLWRLHRSEDAQRIFWLTLVAAFLLLSSFSLVDFQSTTDAFLLLPPALIGVALLIDAWFDTLRRSEPRLPGVAFLAVFTGLFTTGVFESLQIQRSWSSLAWERKVVEEIQHAVPSGGRGVVVGAPQVLALTGWSTRNPYVVVDSGIDRFIDDRYPRGFRGWTEDVLCGPEDVVVLGKSIGLLMDERFRPALRRTHRMVLSYPEWPEHDLSVWRRAVEPQACVSILLRRARSPTDQGLR